MFRIFLATTWLIARLPFPMLYRFSGLLSLVVRKIARYRLKTVTRNLLRAFPSATKDEIRIIRRKFYRNLCDITLEAMKLATISPNELKKRFEFRNFEAIEAALAEGKSVIVTCGHCGNWEWLVSAMALRSPVPFYGVAKPLKKSSFDQYLGQLRSRLNGNLALPHRNTFRAMLRNKNEGLTLNLMIADQTPTPDHLDHWQLFLNQDTPFFIGPERLARALEFDVVYVEVIRTKRGHYIGDIRSITRNAASTTPHEITSSYVRMLEENIRKQPESWLWSHRRWKHKRSVEFVS